MGPLRFELRFLAPQARRMAKLPHSPIRVIAITIGIYSKKKKMRLP